jgi:hypothetical protein
MYKIKNKFNKKSLTRFKFYLKECKKARKEYPQNFNIWNLIKFFPNWQFGLDSESTPLIDEVPWIPFSAIQFLEQVVTKDMQIYEYGSGGSTVFFGKKAKEVISTEHDSEWKYNVEEYLNKHNFSNCKINLVAPKSSLNFHKKSIEDPDSYISDDSRYIDQSFEDYAASINEYPDYYFDIVLIDGRARPSCFKHSVSKVKSNGFIILDNADRSYYSYIHKSLNNKSWKKYSFYGPGSHSYLFWETCFWQKL